MFGGFGWMEITLILVVAVIIFGRKLPEVSRSIGRGIRELQRGLHDIKDEVDPQRLKNELHDAAFRDIEPSTMDDDDFQVTHEPCDDPDEKRTDDTGEEPEPEEEGRSEPEGEEPGGERRPEPRSGIPGEKEQTEQDRDGPQEGKEEENQV